MGDIILCDGDTPSSDAGSLGAQYIVALYKYERRAFARLGLEAAIGGVAPIPDYIGPVDENLNPTLAPRQEPGNERFRKIDSPRTPVKTKNVILEANATSPLSKGDNGAPPTPKAARPLLVPVKPKTQPTRLPIRTICLQTSIVSIAKFRWSFQTNAPASISIRVEPAHLRSGLDTWAAT